MGIEYGLKQERKSIEKKPRRTLLAETGQVVPHTEKLEISNPGFHSIQSSREYVCYKKKNYEALTILSFQTK